MVINLDNFNIRKTVPYNAGPIGLPPGEERYIAKAQGLVGFEIFAKDKIFIKNIEGQQICEVAVFDQNGKSSSGLINNKNIKKVFRPKNWDGKTAARCVEAIINYDKNTKNRKS